MTFKFDTSMDLEVWALWPCLIVQKTPYEMTVATFFLAWGICVDIKW